MECVVIRGVQGAKGSDRGGDGRSEGHRVGSRHGAAELTPVHEGKDILRQFLVVCCMDDSTRRSVNGEKGSPVSCEKGIAA